MGMIEEVGTHLATAGVGTFGTDLFAYAMPEETTGVCTALYETPGSPPGWTFAGDTPKIEYRRLQILTRSTAAVGGTGIADPTNALAKAQAAFDALVSVANETLGSTGVGTSYYLRLDGVQSAPFLLQRDGKGRAIFACNYEVWRT